MNKKSFGALQKMLLVFVGIIAGNTYNVKAQISEGGAPPSFLYEDTLRSSLPALQVTPDFDLAATLAEDAINDSLGFPSRCAKIIPVDLHPENSGEWRLLPDNRYIWTLEIHAPNALALMLYYDSFVIPEGGQLFVYKPDHSRILGAYTHRTNPKRGAYATEMLTGDRIILEYVSPENAKFVPQIKISGIGYGYNHLRGDGELLRSRWDSESCMINVNCSEGDDWQDQKRGVARILTPVDKYVYLCSGTLINNTSNDFDPLFLSAHHCYEGLTESQMNQAVYYFNYEYPACENLGTDPVCPTVVGAQMLVDVGYSNSSDGVLLRLNDSIPESYNVYFNGWYRRNIAATSGVCIHHPAGDVKKISTFSDPASTATWTTMNGVGASSAHWSIRFSQTENGLSVTEGGSSGSPLFNQDGLVVGTLTGGSSSCSTPTGASLYGKLWYHWDKAEVKMSDYLDPEGIGVDSLRGAYVDYRVVRIGFYAENNRPYVMRTVQFINSCKHAATFDWSFEDGEPATSTEPNPSVRFNTAGIHTVTLTVNKDSANEQTLSKEIETIIKEYTCPDEALLDGGSDNAQYPLGLTTRHTFSSALYTAEELNINRAGYISRLSWHANKKVSTNRSLYIYLCETEEDTLTSRRWEEEISHATLVYENTGTFTNDTGWVSVDLTYPFYYSGNKNLKVMVRAYSPTSYAGVSSGCYYSVADKKHTRWTTSSSSVPSTKGVVDGRRPDVHIYIDISCGVESPVADFKICDSIGNDTAQFLIGEKIIFTDMSKGPVVNWEWSFAGANIESSEDEKPEPVHYDSPGVYTIMLRVNNHLGSDTLEKTVQIVSSPPIMQLEVMNSTEGINMYPNPVNDELRIDIPFFQKMEYPNIHIFDISGRAVQTRSIAPYENDAATIDVSHLSKGVYIIKVGNYRGRFVKK